MKKYTQPKITRVKLDPEQAILQVCVVGGAYFGTLHGHGSSYLCRNTGTGDSCGLSIKGIRETGVGGFTGSTQPS